MWKTVKAAAAVALEVSIPLNLLRAEPGQTVAFQLQVHRQQGEQRAVVEAVPTARPIELRVPAPDWTARQWRV